MIEIDESYVPLDLRLARTIAATLEITHLRASEEPLLWVSDALAWCVQRGGRWAASIEPLLERTIDLTCASPARRP